jgi:hypothetical protein
VLTIVVILIINLVIAYTAEATTNFEKHHTRSRAAGSLCAKLFASQFLNTAVSTVIANAYLPALQKAIQGTSFAGIIIQARAAAPPSTLPFPSAPRAARRAAARVGCASAPLPSLTCRRGAVPHSRLHRSPLSVLHTQNP